jgi:hypothetical protein
MTTQKRLKVLFQGGAILQRELRQLLPAVFELHQVQDLRQIDAACGERNSRQRMMPYAYVVEPPPAIAESRDAEQIEMLAALRELYPSMRRIVIAEEDDLALAVTGLHTGLIDHMLHRPLTAVGVATALRPPRAQGSPSPNTDFRAA